MVDASDLGADAREVEREAALIGANIECAADAAGSEDVPGRRIVVEALIEKGSGLLACGGVVVEAKVVECKGRGCGCSFRRRCVREQRAGRGCWELLELADARIGTLPEGERLVARGKLCAEDFDDDLADVILRSALREQLQENEVVIAIGDDAGEVVGLGEDQAVRVVFGSDRGELATERERGCDAGSQVNEVLLAREGGRARDEARDDLRGGGIECGAERDLAVVDYGDQGAGIRVSSGCSISER